MPAIRTSRRKYIYITQALINSAATDAGNRSMRSAGRSKWNDEDYNAAVAEHERLCPSPEVWMELPRA